MFVYTKRCILKCLNVYLCHQTHTPSVAAFSFWLFFFFQFFYLFYFGLCWVFTAAHGLSLVVANRLLIAEVFLVAEHRLWGTGFQELRAQAQQLRHTGLVASRHVGSS